VIDRIEPNPDVSYLAAMYERFWREHADCEAVVAVGGGSAIDTAKALMVGTASGRFDELVALLAKGAAFKPHRLKALIAGAHDGGHRQRGDARGPRSGTRPPARSIRCTCPRPGPRPALVDADLMLTLPASVTVQSGLDALSHSLEAIWNVNANPVSDTYAVAAAREVMATLPSLLENLGRQAAARAHGRRGPEGGMAFSNTKTALAHSISYEMTLRFGLPHGIACSFTLPMVLERAVGADPSRDAVLAAIFGDLAGAAGKLREFLRAVGGEDRVCRLRRARVRLAAHGGAGPRRRAREELRGQPGGARMRGSLDWIDKVTAVVDRISIFAGKAIAWLIVPMFMVLVYEVIVRKFFRPTIWANDIATMCYGAHFFLAGRLHAAPAEAHPHRLLLQELVAQDPGAHGYRAVPADLPARHGDVHLDQPGSSRGSPGTSRKRS
jgi:phosphonate metabolism-associated iron-containing alcohol dehydrogenase